MEFLSSNYGLIFTLIGVALATLLPGLGSAAGVGLVGEAVSYETAWTDQLRPSDMS